MSNSILNAKTSPSFLPINVNHPAKYANQNCFHFEQFSLTSLHSANLLHIAHATYPISTIHSRVSTNTELSSSPPTVPSSMPLRGFCKRMSSITINPSKDQFSWITCNRKVWISFSNFSSRGNGRETVEFKSLKNEGSHF